MPKHAPASPPRRRPVSSFTAPSTQSTSDDTHPGARAPVTGSSSPAQPARHPAFFLRRLRPFSSSLHCSSSRHPARQPGGGGSRGALASGAGRRVSRCSARIFALAGSTSSSLDQSPSVGRKTPATHARPNARLPEPQRSPAPYASLSSPQLETVPLLEPRSLSGSPPSWHGPHPVGRHPPDLGSSCGRRNTKPGGSGDLGSRFGRVGSPSTHKEVSCAFISSVPSGCVARGFRCFSAKNGFTTTTRGSASPPSSSSSETAMGTRSSSTFPSREGRRRDMRRRCPTRVCAGPHARGEV